MGIKVKNGEIIRGNTPLSKNEEEAINNYEKTMKDAKPFGVKSEEEMKEYEVNHPEAIRDVEKARVMAEAGDELETLAAKRGAKAVELVKRISNPEPGAGFPTQKEVDHMMSAAGNEVNIANTIREKAYKKEEAAGENYDKSV